MAVIAVAGGAVAGGAAVDPVNGEALPSRRRHIRP